MATVKRGLGNSASETPFGVRDQSDNFDLAHERVEDAGELVWVLLKHVDIV